MCKGYIEFVEAGDQVSVGDNGKLVIKNLSQTKKLAKTAHVLSLPVLKTSHTWNGEFLQHMTMDIQYLFASFSEHRFSHVYILANHTV